MVEFDNAGFAFGAKEVLRGASLRVEQGSFCAVYGPTAAGKTTLMRLLRGEIAPTAGEVRVFGHPVPAGDRHRLAGLRRRVALVESRNRFLNHLTVGENVAAALLAGGAGAGRQQDISALLTWVGLGGRMGDLPCALTADESRRAALARALINSPELLLADEPAYGLSAEEALDLVAYFAEVNAMGTTVVFATSDAALAEHLLALRPVQVAYLAAGRLEAPE